MMYTCTHTLRLELQRLLNTTLGSPLLEGKPGPSHPALRANLCAAVWCL